MDASAKIQAAQQTLQSGQPAQARQMLEEITRANPGRADAWNWLSIACARGGDFANARAAIQRALTLHPDDAQLHLTAANVHQDSGLLSEAVRHARKATEIRPDFAEAYNNLGILLSDLGKIEEAEAAFHRATELKPAYARALANLAGVYLRLNRVPEALESAQRAATQQPEYAHAWFLQGTAFLMLGQAGESDKALRRALQLQPDYPEAALLLARQFHKRGNYDDAERLIKNALQHAPRRADLWSFLGENAASGDDMQGALAAYQQALALKPDDLTTMAKAALYLPNIYLNAGHLSDARRRYTDGLEYLRSRFDSLRPSITRERISAILPGSFFLGYQGLDDRVLQRRYADLAREALIQVMPAYFAAIEKSPTAGRRVRIGFCSRFFYRSTVGNYFASWISGLDRDEFEIFVYCCHNQPDDLTKAVSASADHFFQQDAPVPYLAEKIRGDALDILVYPELGMDLTSYLLGAMRLAPIQVCAWGHPVTPGHRNIDYFMSCEQMEPPAAQTHYNEQLILLPGIGTRYELPSIPAGSATKSRADFQLPDDKVLYLLPQSLFKVHPDNDSLIVEILARHEQAVLVMFSSQSRNITQKFVARLNQAFAAKGLQPSGRVKILPSLSHADYKRVNQLCDVMLDTLYWSGGNTSLDALAVGLPIVTLPGEFMRGRQSMAMLSLLGMHELIARDTEDYVEIALRVGNSPELRRELAARILVNRGKLFDDPSPPQAFAARMKMLCQAAAGNSTNTDR